MRSTLIPFLLIAALGCGGDDSGSATAADVDSGVRVGDQTYPGYPALGAGIRAAVEEYIADMQAMTFPSDDESFKMEQAVVEELEAATSRR